MATDATGAPTPLGIPKYNTSADAPSGLGFNAAMDAIDALIAAKVGKPVGIASGEVPVWNGSAFVRSTTTNVGPTSLGSGTPDATKFLRGDGTWAAAAGGIYRKTTAKTVAGTVTETDLLNGEIIVAANAIGVSGVLRLTAWGDWKNNSGAGADLPRFKLKLGGTTLLDTGITGVNAALDNATRRGWRMTCEIENLGAANSQWATLDLRLELGSNLGGGGRFTTGEGTYISSSAGFSNAIAFALGGNSGAVDTSVAAALVLSVINASASASYDTVLKGALVEVV